MFFRIISKDDKEVIETIYAHFNAAGDWIGSKTLRLKIGPQKMDKLSKKYEPRLFIRQSREIFDHFELTIRGILSCSESEPDKNLLLGFLNMARDSYSRNPELRFINSSDIARYLELESGKLNRLRILLGILFNGYGDTIKGNEWNANIPDDIELLFGEMSTETYLNRLIEQRYRRDKSNKSGGTKIRDKIKIGFWILLVSQIWTLTMLLTDRSSSTRSYFIIGSIWISLFSISNISRLFGTELALLSPKKFFEKLVWYIVTIGVSILTGLLLKYI